MFTFLVCGLHTAAAAMILAGPGYCSSSPTVWLGVLWCHGLGGCARVLLRWAGSYALAVTFVQYRLRKSVFLPVVIEIQLIKSDTLKPTWRSKQLKAQQRNKRRCRGICYSYLQEKAGPLPRSLWSLELNINVGKNFVKFSSHSSGDDVLKHLTQTEVINTAANTQNHLFYRKLKLTRFLI